MGMLRVCAVALFAAAAGLRRGSTAQNTSAGLTCDEAAWPDKDHGLVCGECKVLVNHFNSTYGTCNGYCAAVGRQCVGAWEEQSDNCNVLHDMVCHQTLASSDAICQCGEEVGGVCYGELDGLASDEGGGIGVPDIVTGSDAPCKDACSGNANCQSFSYCPQWGKCWLKDRSFSGGEPATPGTCKTYYKKPCDGAPPSQAPTPAPGSGGPIIKVVSYNLYWWNAFQQNPWKSDSIVRNIKDVLQPDILGLQECDEPGTISARAAYEAVSPFMGAQGVVAKPGLFAVEQSGSRDLQATGKWGPRYVTWAKVTHLPSSRSFWHFNTHWCVHSGNGQTCSPDKRHVGAKNMLQVIQEQAGAAPVVVTGDFNADVDEAGMREFYQNGFALARFNRPDGVLYSQDHWLLVNAWVGDAAGSDHNPVIANLELRQ